MLQNWPEDKLRTVGVLALHGLVLGSVGGFVMGWLSPVLPNWIARIVVAALVGAVLAGRAYPQADLNASIYMIPVGIVVAVISAVLVWRSG